MSSFSTPNTSLNQVLTIYKASAGSGKTYTLTFEYILALLAVKNPDTGQYRLNHPHYSRAGVIPNRHRGILAITFTNKATEEMKRRITSRLHDLTRLPEPGEKDADYAKELCEITGCSRTELAQTAMSALHQLLYDFNNFNVSTIDSFFQRVLRGFARELDRQGDFEVELNENSAMNAAVDNMLDDFNIDWRWKKPFEDWLTLYMRTLAVDGKKADILNRNSHAHNELVNMIAHITAEAFTPYEKEMKQYLYAEPDRISQAIGTVRTRISSLRKEVIDRANDLITKLLDVPKSHGMYNASYNFLVDFLAKGRMDEKKLKTHFSRVNAGTLFNKSSNTPAELQQEAYETYKFCCLNLFHIQELRLIEKGLHTLTFLKFAWSYLDNLCIENNIVLLANTNSLIHRLIDGSDVPFIYERLGLRLHHFLIDEFQDTSIKQWENLKPLIANSVADRHDNLIIGDVKQSIYRFRNSEPDLLHRRVQEDDFPGTSRLRGAEPKDNTNYRSSVEVVTFNNTFFGRLAQMFNAPGYEHVVQAVPEKNADYHGFVHFIPNPKKEKSTKDGVTSDDSKKALSDEEKIIEKRPSFPIMAKEIHRQIDEGHYRFKDIAILCRRTAECAEAIEYLMKFHPDLPVVTSETLLLAKSPAVKLIISMLRLIADYQSARAVVRTANKDFATTADMRLMMSRFEYYANNPDLNLDNEQALSHALGENENVQCAVAEILSPHPASIQALIDNIITMRLPMAMRESQLPYLLALQDYVTEYSEHGIQSVNAFLSWWDEHSSKFSIPLGSDIDAINVLTIHKSKGLEFACVHIPLGSWEMTSKEYIASNRWIPTPEIEDIAPDVLPPVMLLSTGAVSDLPNSIFDDNIRRYKHQGESDSINLTYVAYTRAASELLVYYDPAKSFGQDIASCLSADYTSQEQNAEFTIDLARHFDSTSGELSIGEPTVSETYRKELALSPEQRSRQEALKATLPQPYHPTYHVYQRDDTRVITSVDTLLDTDIDDTAEPARPVGSEPPQVRRGNMLHEILSNTRRATDLPDAVALVAAEAVYSPDEVREAGKFLSGVLNMERKELARWFRDFDHVLCEQSIFVNDSDAPFPYTKRPDRIVFYNDGTAEVVDFKFTSEERPEHITQVQEYVDLLGQMGITVRDGRLWYPLLPGAPIIKC